VKSNDVACGLFALEIGLGHPQVSVSSFQMPLMSSSPLPFFSSFTFFLFRSSFRNVLLMLKRKKRIAVDVIPF
jgi:hypothetical protein